MYQIARNAYRNVIAQITGYKIANPRTYSDEIAVLTVIADKIANRFPSIVGGF